MADISKITVGNTTYNIKDASAIHANGIWYGTCTTAKATADKVATLNNSEGFSLTTGVIVAIKFTYASCAAPMTLAVNSTAAKVIMQYGTTQASSGTTTSGWVAGATVIFIYDGTNWVRAYWSNTTYTNMTQAEATTGTATSARSISAVVLNTTIDNKITGKESTSNKVTSISSSSTDTQYPSAKCVYDAIQAGGGGSAPTTTTVTIATSDWSSLSCTKNVTGMTSSKTIIVSCDPASFTAYTDAGVRCSAQGSGTLTFVCDTVPSASVTANILIW